MNATDKAVILTIFYREYKGQEELRPLFDTFDLVFPASAMVCLGMIPMNDKIEALINEGWDDIRAGLDASNADWSTVEKFAGWVNEVSEV